MKASPLPSGSPIETSFSRAAARYADHANVQKRMAGWLAEWLPPERRGNALEMGAGPGLFTRNLLPWTGRLAVSDLSPAMCAQGRDALPGLEWLACPAETPPPGPWDWIFSSSMLQWVENPREVFSAWHASLAPGGRVLAGLFVEECLPELRALTGGWSPLVWRSPGSWLDAAEGAGLRVQRQEVRREVVLYPSALQLLRSLHGVGAAPERRFGPGGLRRLLIEYGRRHGTGQGVASTWTFLRFEAERPSLD